MCPLSNYNTPSSYPFGAPHGNILMFQGYNKKIASLYIKAVHFNTPNKTSLPSFPLNRERERERETETEMNRHLLILCIVIALVGAVDSSSLTLSDISVEGVIYCRCNLPGYVPRVDASPLSGPYSL
jgi:hypothetical protein